MMRNDELPCQNSEYDWPQKCHGSSCCTGLALIPPSRLPNLQGAGRIFLMPRVKYFRVVFVGVVLVAVVIAAMMVFSESSRRDPVYNGIRLSEILGDEKLWRSTASGTREVAIMVFGVDWIVEPGNFTSYSSREREYFHAFHHLGETAWPVLLSEFQAKDPKLKTWVRDSDWVPQFISERVELSSDPGGTGSDPRRTRLAFLAIRELILPPAARDEWMDPTWHGIEEFPPQFRRKLVVDLADALRVQLKDLRMASSIRVHSSIPRQMSNIQLKDLQLASGICYFLGRLGTNGLAATPALEMAVQSRVLGSKEALARVRGEDITRCVHKAETGD